MYVGGDWVDAESGETADVVNPATERILGSVPKGSGDDVAAAVDAARASFDSGAWSTKTPAERSKVLWKLADLVEQNAGHLAEIESKNVGKTIKYSRDSDLPF